MTLATIWFDDLITCASLFNIHMQDLEVLQDTDKDTGSSKWHLAITSEPFWRQRWGHSALVLHSTGTHTKAEGKKELRVQPILEDRCQIQDGFRLGNHTLLFIPHWTDGRRPVHTNTLAYGLKGIFVDIIIFTYVWQPESSFDFILYGCITQTHLKVFSLFMEYKKLCELVNELFSLRELWKHRCTVAAIKMCWKLDRPLGNASGQLFFTDAATRGKTEMLAKLKIVAMTCTKSPIKSDQNQTTFYDVH